MLYNSYSFCTCHRSSCICCSVSSYFVHTASTAFIRSTSDSSIICNSLSSRLKHLSSSALPQLTALDNLACRSSYNCRCSSSYFSVSLRSSSSYVSPRVAVVFFSSCKRSFSSHRRFTSACSVPCRWAFSASKRSFSCLKSSTCNLRLPLNMFALAHARSRVSTHSSSSLSRDVSP